MELSRRLEREWKTLHCMSQIYCRDHHAQELLRKEGLCKECEALMVYARRRLAKCPYGDSKPACNHCPIHCYKRRQRDQVRAVMRYAGPRMTLRHPLRALTHLYNTFRRVEHPLEIRRRAGTPSRPVHDDRHVDPPNRSRPPR